MRSSDAMGRPVILFVLFIVCSTELPEETRVLYKTSRRPQHMIEKTKVNVTMFVNNLGPVREDDMTYNVDIFLRQEWVDSRTQYSKEELGLGPGDESIVLPFVEPYNTSIWLPDTYFMNSVRSQIHTVMTANGYIEIRPNGHVTLSVRVTITALCHMVLSYFPMDIQMCPLQIESYRYSSAELEFQESRIEGIVKDQVVERRDNIRLPHFTLKEAKTKVMNVTYFGNTYSRFEVMFKLERYIGYYFVDCYFPAILIVVLSWTQFFIGKNATPARATLTVTSVLTIITLIVSVNSRTARLSKIKALDIYFALCLSYVFAGLVEFGLVCYFNKPQLIARKAHHYHHTHNFDIGTMNENGEKRTAPDVPETTLDIDDSDEGCCNGETFWKWRERAILNVSMIDRVARVMFPLSFLLANVAYWTAYYLDSDSTFTIN